jgi:hypothetical protein
VTREAEEISLIEIGKLQVHLAARPVLGRARTLGRLLSHEGRERRRHQRGPEEQEKE